MSPKFITVTTISIFTVALIGVFVFFYVWPIIEIKLSPQKDTAKWDLILEGEKNDLEKLKKLQDNQEGFITLEQYEAERDRFSNISITKKEVEDIIVVRKYSDIQKGFAINYPSNYKITNPTQNVITLRSDFDCSQVVGKICIFQEISVEVLSSNKNLTAEEWLEENSNVYEFEEYVEISDRNALLAYPVGTAKEDPRYIIKNQDKLYLLDFSASVAPDTRETVLSSFNFISFGADGVRDDNLEQTIISISKAAISNMRNQNLYRYAHPLTGIRFSPYANINKETDQVFSVQEMVDGFNSDEEIIWGSYDGTGEPIKLTFKDYYNNFIYDKDYSLPTKIGYNTKVGKGNSKFNFLEVYDSSVFVEYYIEPAFGENELNWSSLVLVFQEYNNEWYIVGVVHDQWTI